MICISFHLIFCARPALRLCPTSGSVLLTVSYLPPPFFPAVFSSICPLRTFMKQSTAYVYVYRHTIYVQLKLFYGMQT